MLISLLLKTETYASRQQNKQHRDSRTNTSDIIDYIISSLAIYNNIQDLSLNNDLPPDHSAILFDFSTNINKSIPFQIKVKFYCKAEWDSINCSLSKQLAILQAILLFFKCNLFRKP